MTYCRVKYIPAAITPATYFGDASWGNVESVIARFIGSIDVATMDHHRHGEAVHKNLISALQEHVSTADDPVPEVLIRIISKSYEGTRDLFAANMMEADKQVIGPLIDQWYQSHQGHEPVGFMPCGSTYSMMLPDDATTTRCKRVFSSV